MKVVILAGGFGTRLSEETGLRPKPLVEIGAQAILWHIMKIYAHHGLTDFVICAGYKAETLSQYFHSYAMRMSDITVRTATGEVEVLKAPPEDWNVTVINTGLETMTGGRVKAVAEYLPDDEPFCLTYGDGVGDIDIQATIDFHKSHGKLATVTAVTPPGRFGVLDIDGHSVKGFREKLASDQYRINAGFFVLDKKAIDYIDGPATS